MILELNRGESLDRLEMKELCYFMKELLLHLQNLIVSSHSVLFFGYCPSEAWHRQFHHSHLINDLYHERCCKVLLIFLMDYAL